MNIADLRQRYKGYSDDEIVSALQATKYQDFSAQEIRDVLGVKPAKRSLFAVANDTVIEAANAAAGTVGSIANFVSPGNAVSEFIDENIIKAGEANQSDAVKADKARFRDRMESAEGVMDEVGAVGGYIADAPLQALAQAVGSFAVPAGAIKGAQALAGGQAAARASAAGAARVQRAGLAGGVAVGAAGAGGDAAGTAYELVKNTGATDEEATAAARGASIIPAAIGGLGGMVGAERLLAGAGGFKGGLMSRALKTAGVEGLQEGVEEGVTQFEGQRAAVPFDPTINPMKGVAGAATMGAALGAATGGGMALLVRQEAADRGLEDLKAAETPDEAIDAALRATDVPLEVPPSKPLAFDRDGVILPDNARPRARNQVAMDEIRQLDPAQQQEALGLLATAENPSAAPGVRRFAQNQLDALLLPVRQIPTGETTDMLPAGEARELSDEERAAYASRRPFSTQRALDRGIPEGEATEIDPENIELETIPQPDVYEEGGERPAGMAERTRKPAPQAPAAPMTDDMLVRSVLDRFRTTNTPQARAFVQDFEAGRITPADVLKLIGRPPASPDERLAAAAAQAPKPAELQPGDLLTGDGMPYGTKSGATVRAKREGGSVIEVPGGWAVRPRDAAPEQQPVQAVAPESTGGGVSQSGPAVDTKQPDATAPTSVAQDLEALRNRDRGYRAPEDVRAALERGGLRSADKFKDTGWSASVADGRGDLEVEIDPATGEASVTGSYMGRELFQRSATGGPAISAALDEARAGLEEGERRRKALKTPPAPQLESAPADTEPTDGVQFGRYEQAINAADTVGGGMLDEIRADERLTAAEADRLLAMATPKTREGKAAAANVQDRQGLRESDRRKRDIDAAASELVGQIVNDMKDSEDGKADFDAAEVLPGLRLFAESSKVPADELRQAVLERLRRPNYVTKRQLGVIERALNPTLKERADRMRNGQPADANGARRSEVKALRDAGDPMAAELRNEGLLPAGSDKANGWKISVGNAGVVSAVRDGGETTIMRREGGKVTAEKTVTRPDEARDVVRSYIRQILDKEQAAAAPAPAPATAPDTTPPATKGTADKPGPAKPETAPTAMQDGPVLRGIEDKLNAEGVEVRWANAKVSFTNVEAEPIGIDQMHGKARELARQYLTAAGLPAPAAEPDQRLPDAKPAITASANTLVTEDAAERARAVIRAKLRGNTLNSGVDPELLQAGITLAAYHVERGARKFAAYARAMVDDLGDSVKPYLQSWYMAARADPSYAALRADMDKASAVEDLDVDQVLAAAEADPADTAEGLVNIPATEEAFAEALGGAMDATGAAEGAFTAGDQTRGDRARYEATFRPDTKPVSLPRVTSAKPKPEGVEFLSRKEADKKLAEWQAEADRQGRQLASQNSRRTVISLFDASGVIAQPWIDAGYNVVSYDLQTGADINSFDAENLLETHGNDEVWAVLAQPPCTDFAASGAQWWKKKDADGRTEASNELVRQVMRTVELFRPPVWVMENPIGRIQNLNKLPDPLLSFDPWHYGDDYSKRTLLWGKFDPNLPTAYAEPTEGSKIHRMSSSAKYERSLTSENFAYALFMANNAEAMPLGRRMAMEFAGVEPALFDAAIKAGATESQVRDAIEDAFYDSDLDFVREELERLAAVAPAPAADTAPTNDPFAGGYAALEGKMIEQRITTDDGKTATLRMDAAVALRDFDSRETALEDLRLCLVSAA